MVEKMKFLSISGPKFDLDRVAEVYLSKYEMHLENSLAEFETVKDLRAITESNPYKELLSQADELTSIIPNSISSSDKDLSISDATDIISDAYKSLSELREKKDAIKTHKNELTDILNKIEPFRILNFDISQVINFNFIKFRYGKMTHEHFDKFLNYEYPNWDVIFIESDSNDSFVWGMYFVPAQQADRIDAIFSSLHFERIHFPKENISGTTEEIYQSYAKQLQNVSSELKDISNQIKEFITQTASDILSAKNVLYNLSKNNDIRKFAACTKERGILSNNKHAVFYILCGWMCEKDATKFLKEIEDDPNVFSFSETEKEHVTTSIPPTKLRNPRLCKPFEMFIKMYGLPSYNEFDPTVLLAITYSILFGAMFGDVGQGILLFIGGLLFYKLKKLDLGAIIASAGFFSTIFGFLYGSVFGFEDKFFEHVWISPSHDINTILITTIGVGIGLIVISMILNIINGIKVKDYERIFFDTNGLAGLVFYCLLIGFVVLYITGRTLPPIPIIILALLVPLVVVFLREPLGRKAKGKKKMFTAGFGSFFLEAFFELFEILLSFVTNSLSFVRVGAFALSHAGMMGVVLMLAGAENSSTTPNILILVFGNLFVMLLEGLSVAIQVLRLEYFEMFSRYYSGTGRDFVPFKKAS